MLVTLELFHELVNKVLGVVLVNKVLGVVIHDQNIRDPAPRLESHLEDDPRCVSSSVGRLRENRMHLALHWQASGSRRFGRTCPLSSGGP